MAATKKATARKEQTRIDERKARGAAPELVFIEIDSDGGIVDVDRKRTTLARRRCVGTALVGPYVLAERKANR